MALISCPECGRQISVKAKLCPGCGTPISNPNITKRLLSVDLKISSVLIFIFLYVVLSFIPAIAIFHMTEIETITFTEILYFTTQILSSIFVTTGFVIALWQYYLAAQINKRNMAIDRAQKAIDLAEYYKDSILYYLPAICYIFDASGASEILQSVDYKNFTEFNKRELTNLFIPEKISHLREIQNSEIFINSILEANKIYNLRLDIKLTSIDTELGSTLKIDKSSILIEYMSNLINSTLNNMEYFALHFKHGTADESVVYQSLHQTYLQIMPYLYYYIANNNEDPANKLYTNVIWLYNKWTDVKNRQEEERGKHEEKISRTGTIVASN